MRKKLLEPLLAEPFMGIGEKRALPVLKNPDGRAAVELMDALATALRKALPHLPDHLRAEAEVALERLD